MAEQADTTSAPKADKPKKLSKTDELKLKVAELEARVEKFERNQKVITDGFEFAANEVRPLYGFGALAVIFDAIHKKLAG